MLKQLFTLLTIILIYSGPGLAQGRLQKSKYRSHYTYIYQVNSKEAQQIFTRGRSAVNNATFHTLIDSFAVNSNYNKKLPQGHYLFLHSNGPELVYKLQTYSALATKLMPAKPGLGILVHDSLGNIIPDAAVRYKSKKATYDQVSQTYQFKHKLKPGLLTVTYQDFTQFENLEKEEKYEYGSRFLRKFINTFPLPYLWRPFYDVYNSFRWHHPQGLVRSLFSVFSSQYQRTGSHQFRGYLVTNKPLYQPGDTVKYKAFVVDAKGKPVKEKALLFLNNYGQPVKKLGIVESYRNGAYAGQFVLHDSLKLELDRTYTLVLRKPGQRQTILMSSSFGYEDYELKENEYSLSLKAAEHQTGEANSLTLRGTNANGLNLPDARVEVLVITRKVIKSEEPEIFVADTLWVHQQPLDAVGATTITLPDNIFPKASVDYAVTATFLTSNNERSTLTKNATYQYTKGNLKLSLLQDSLLVQYLESGLEKPKAAVLKGYNPEYDNISTLKLQLPARIPLNAFAASYEVVAGNLDANLELSEEAALVGLNTSRQQDSLFFALQNPRRLPYWYYVYRGEKLVARGQGNEKNFAYQHLAKGEQPYFVWVHYLWAGKMQKLAEDVPLRKHLLAMDLQAPAVVYPGQQADLKVTVKDAAGRPVPGVDLTAYAITAKFKNQHLPAIPIWDKYKKQKLNRSLVKEANETSGKKQLDWLYWRKRMGLDSIAYYNFLYPKNGIFQEYTITRDSITQISPYLVEAGRVVPVHVVYLDEVPVYFSQTDVLPPYAFAADSGYHTVKLRTADKLITLDSLYLPHKRKLIVSADLTDPENRFIQPAEKEVLTAQEQKLLYRYLLPIVPAPNHGLAYLQQGNRVHLLQRNNQDQQVNNALRRGNHLVTGPFSPTWMQYVSLDSFRTNFKMEPGYSYQFEPHLVKMREWKLPEHKIRLPKWYRWNHKPALLHEEALTDRKIQENYEATQRERLLGRLYGANTTKEYQQGRGKLGWSLENRIKTGVKLVLLHETAYPDSLLIYSKTSNILFNLKPAAYTLTLVLDNGNILTAKPTIKANGQTQVHFQEKDITVATPQSNYLLQVLDKKIAQLKKAENDKNEAQQQQLQTFRETTFSYTSGVEQFSHLVTGVVTEENGETLPGVTVVVKGTQIGTNTDAGGRFQIYVPENGILVFNFIGYVAKEEQINGRDIISVKLAPDVKMLQEVVVIGYGIQKNRAVTASASTVLQGRATGITIRGTATVKAEEAKPLIIVDGVPYSGSLANIKDKVETKILKTEEAAALYGAVAAAGVIIITTQKGGALTNGDESLFQNANAIRQNFSDYAIWQPRLTTNQQGEVSFKATFPDDVTKWHAYVLGMDNKKHSGVFQTSINSFKAMLATLHLPRFLIEGDKTTVVGKALNYLPDSALVSTRFEVGEKPMPEAQKLLKRNFTDTLGITAPVSGPDSLAVLYSLKQPNGFVDGEKRFVRLYPKGVAETVGLFLPLPTDTTFTLTFDPAKGPVRLRTQGNLLPVMLDEINYLHRYEYWCTEQAASKLKGLVLEKQIREQLGQPFAHDQIVKKLVRHLEKTQLPDGAWTWWQQGPAYAWITSHVVEALAMAGQASYPVKYQGQKLVDYFVYQLEKESSYDGLTALETLHKLQVKVDYNRYVSKFEKKKKLTLEDQLRLTRLRQHLKLPVQLDTLLKYQQQTMLGGLYWGEAKNSLFDNNISNTILAYEILKIAGNQERKLAQIRAYLLSQRRTGHWRNTYEAARVLETLLPDLLPGESGKTELLPNNVSFSGAVNYHSKRLLTDTTFVPTNSLQVKKAGNAPLYLTAYQTLWNKTPQPVQKDFRVITSFKGLKGNIPLKAGTPVDLLVEVEVKADADYVMIQVPIPAGCSYESKAGKGPYEVHREYFRQKVNIFCDKLPKGKYTYTIKLLPRFTGAYTLNPATAELMYFPTFFGRNELKQIRVQ